MEKVAEPSWTSSYTYQVSRHSAEMLHNLNVQRKDGGRFCDVLLRVGEESFPAHKAVLAACSEYFEAVFGRQAEGDGDARELEMHTISPKVFKDILDFAYTSRIVVRLECFPELMTAAKFLLMRSVIEICQEVIKQSNVQILVPTARAGDASLFQAGGPIELGFPVPPQDLVNGAEMLLNGQSFAAGAHMHAEDHDGAAAAAMLEDGGESSVPMLEPVEGLSVCPSTEITGSAAHPDAGSPASKRGRGRPKKETSAHFNHNNNQKHGELFPCGACGKAFTEASRLKNHEAQHGASSGGVSSLPDSLSALPGGLALDNGRKRERTRRHVGCEICGKVFRDVYHLNRHKLSHSGEKPYACPVCGLRFKRKDRMSYHVRSHDGSVGKPYVCQSCGKGFSRPDHLNGHIKQVHTTERPHKCQTCVPVASCFSPRLRQRVVFTGCRVTRSSLSPATRASACSLSCSWGSQAALRISGSVTPAGGLASPPMSRTQVSTVRLRVGGNDRKCPHLDSEESDMSFGCDICGQAFRTKSYLNKHQHRVHKAQRPHGLSGSGLSDMASSLTSPFSLQQNMSLLESFGFQIVQSAFASSLVDADAGQSGIDFGGK
uniref:POZ/BTB and AT hook containing zinc finger 1 n=1 Tax=Oryzias sinensis TaxID=183150 RepID=A0A8C7ZEN1_9TELE